MNRRGLHFDEGGTAEGTGRTGALSLLSTIFVGGSRLVTNVLLGRLGGAELLGLTQNLMSMASIAALFLPTSAGSAASRNVAFHMADSDAVTAREVAAFISMRAFHATLFVSAVVFVITLSFRSLGLGTALVALLLVLATCGHAVVRGLHYGTGQVPRLVRWEISASVLSLVAVGVMLFLGVRNAWVLAPFAGIMLVFIVMSWPIGAGRGLSRIIKRDIDRFMFLGVVGTLSSSGFLQSSVLVATAINGLAYAGHYAAALSLTTPVSLIAGATSLALFPAMAGDHGRRDTAAIRRRTRDVTSVLITMMVAVLGVLALLSDLVTSIIWGPEFAASAGILVLLLVAVVVTTVAIPSVNALTTESNRGMAMSAASSVLGFAVGIIVWVSLATAFPLWAVPVGYLTGAVVIAAVPYIIMWRRQSQRWAGQTILFATVIGTITAIVVVLSMVTAPWWVAVCCATAFLAIWMVVRGGDVATMTRLFCGLLKRRSE